MKEKLRKMTGTKQFTLFIFLLVIVVVIEVLSKGMLLSFRNVRSILQDVAVVTLLAAGCGMLLISGNTDLSLGGVGTLGPMVLAFCMAGGIPWYIAVIIALAVSALCGCANAVMVNFLNFPTFIATMAMASISQGVAYTISQGKNINIDDGVLTYIGKNRLFNFVPYTFIIALAVLVFFAIMLNQTKFGRSVYLIGGNAEAARLAGLKPKKISFILFINASCIACLAGILMSARLKTATCTGLSGSQFTGITAAILGGVSFGGGSGGLMGALIGIFILSVFNNGMQLLGVSTYLQTVASGGLLLAALLYDNALEKRKLKRVLR